MRPSAAIARGTRTLGSAAEARTLLAHIRGIEVSALALAAEFTDAELAAFDALVQRRLAGEPLQHLTGRAYFAGIEVAVGPGVFIPRPETELLASWALERLEEITKDAEHQPVVVELCAGSGAMSRALATQFPAAQYHAVELSADAAAYLTANLADTAVQVVVGDMADALGELDGTVDLLVVNPPYVPVTARADLPRDVLADPDLALFSGADGLDAIRVVVASAGRLLRAGGWVGCEHDDAHGVSAPELFTRAGFEEVDDHVDLAGRPRFVVGRRPQLPGRMEPVTTDQSSLEDAQPDPAAQAQSEAEPLDSAEHGDTVSMAAGETDELAAGETDELAELATDAAAEDAGEEVEPEPVAEPEPEPLVVLDIALERERALNAAADAVAAGQVIVLPTDTVYGVAADPFSPDAVQRLLDAKQRGRDMPPPVLVAEVAMVRSLSARADDRVTKLGEAFWPGALTLVLAAPDSLRMDLGDRQGTIAVRVPDHDFTRDLLRLTGPLAVSSANVSGRDAALTIDEATEQLGGTISVYLDAGVMAGPVPSTIIDLSTDAAALLRAGRLSRDEINAVVPDLLSPEPVVEPSEDEADAESPVEAEGSQPAVHSDADASDESAQNATETEVEEATATGDAAVPPADEAALPADDAALPADDAEPPADDAAASDDAAAR